MSSKATHYEVDQAYGMRAACGSQSKETRMSVESVTCGSCKRTKAYRAATRPASPIVDAQEAMQADLFERARSLGYTDESAACVADCLVAYDHVEDPCPTHPGHSTSIRDGYAVDSCEACDVIKLTDDAGYTLAGWEAIQAARAAESAALQAAEDAYVAALATVTASTVADCICGDILDKGAAALPESGDFCPGCGSIFTREGTQASADVESLAQAVIDRNMAARKRAAAAAETVADRDPFAQAMAETEREESGVSILAGLLSLDGSTPAKVIGNATTGETIKEVSARHKREQFKVGDLYTFSRTINPHRLWQERPMSCRVNKGCQCGTCNGTSEPSHEVISDVIHWASGGLDIKGDKGGYRMVRPDRLD